MSRKGKPSKPVRRSEYGGRGANIAGIVVLSVFAVIALLTIFRVRIPMPHIPLPAQLDSTPARVILVFSLLVLLLLAGATLLKAREARKARAWPGVQGRITVSRRIEGPVEPVSTNAPLPPEIEIEFTYEVAGTSYIGDRPTLAERIAGTEADRLLARYPAGTEVTVFHDPADPSVSVLERDTPDGMAGGCLLAVIAGLAVMFFLMRLVTEGPAFLTALTTTALPGVDLTVLMVFLVPAAFFLIPAGLMLRNSMTVRRWPITEAFILQTGVRQTGSDDAARVHYPQVKYRYTVGGKEYAGNTISHGMTAGGGRGHAEKVIARYPVGSRIPVRYNPENPQQAALEARFSWMGWVLLVLGLLFVVIALIAATSD